MKFMMHHVAGSKICYTVTLTDTPFNYTFFILLSSLSRNVHVRECVGEVITGVH